MKKSTLPESISLYRSENGWFVNVMRELGTPEIRYTFHSAAAATTFVIGLLSYPAPSAYGEVSYHSPGANCIGDEE